MRLVSTMVLTRILIPDDFALIGLSLSFIFIMQLLTDAGFRSYILKQPGLYEPNVIDNLWTIHIIRGVVLYLLLILLAYPISAFFKIDGLFESLLILSHVFLLSGASSLAPLIADRENKPAKPILIQFFAEIAGSIITIITTIIFQSKWCVILGVLYPPMMILIASYSAFHNSRHKIHFNKQFSYDFFQWSKFIIPSSIITLIISQSDKALLGKLLTPEILGMYFIAYNLTSAAERFVISFARRIIGPALAEKRHRDSQHESRLLVDAFYGARNRATLLICAGLGAACGLSPLIVKIIYDDRYTYVSVFMAILLIRPALCLVSYPIESFLMVLGNARITLQSNIVRIVWVGLAVYPLCYFFGWPGAIATFIVMELVAVIFFVIMAHKNQCLRLKWEVSFLIVFAISYFVVAEIEPSITGLISTYVPI